MAYLYEEKNIYTLRTFRRNRLPNHPFTKETIFMKRKRETYEKFIGSINNTPICLLTWRDNRIVNLASTTARSIPETKVRRYDRKMKTTVEVVRPYIIETYNCHMGGLDSLDANFART